MMQKFMAVVMMALIAGVGFADMASDVVGRWTAGAGTLDFYGQGIGRDVGESVYFRYSFPSSDQIVMDNPSTELGASGAGETEQYTIAVTETNLTLADTNNTQTVYTKQTWALSPCTINLRQIDGAMVLFTMDHPAEGGTGEGMPPMGVYDLIPTYLTEIPVCPEGGIYLISAPPQCNIPGHGLGE